MLEIDLKPSLQKKEIADRLRLWLSSADYKIVAEDFNRPWGGFFRIDDAQINKFRAEFFKGVELPKGTEKLSLSPKILVVEPGKRLSWQDHERRSEQWCVINGPIEVYRSTTDDQPEKPEVFETGAIVNLAQGERHRLSGSEVVIGVVAEIWIHSDSNDPSDEADVRRIQDDFGR